MPRPIIAGERLSQTSEPDERAAPPARGRPPQRRRRRGFLEHLLGGITGLVLGILVLALLGLGGAGYVLYTRYSANLPDVTGLRAYQPPTMTRVYASDSELMAELATERRIYVPFAAIPDLVKKAFVAAEDQSFFTHPGVDPLAILRAAVTDALNYGAGKRPIGASTITQQVAKNILLNGEMTVSRKIKEALLAIRIERALSKERILEIYLNAIYLGEGAYGVAAAAQTYFDKPLTELTPAEAAFLAALPKAPNNYNPQRYPDAARNRRDWVLDRMVETRALTAEQAAAAKSEPLVQTASFRRPDQLAGGQYFAAEVKHLLIQRFGQEQALQGGLTVRTSLDPAMQATADRVLRAGLMKYDMAHDGWRGPVAHVPGGAALRTDWQAPLAAVVRPPGMLPEWQLAVVVATSGSAAEAGFFDRATGAARTLRLGLADLGWAHPVHAGVVGPAPRRIEDVLQAGDVVMAEIAPAQSAASKGGPRAERLLLRQIPQIEGALVSIDPATGRVLALSGGWSYEISQFDRATQAQRQPGSSFKPLVYLTAMQQGISPSQIFLDAPIVLDDGTGGQWRPGNYELDFNGPVPLHVALEKSLNLVTVRVARRVGMSAVAANAIAFHWYDAMPRVLPAALGAVETTVSREAGFYAALAAGGREVVPTLIDTVQDRNGKLLWRNPAVACQGCDDPSKPPEFTDQRRAVADPQSAFQVVMMMQGVVNRGTGTPARIPDRQIAGKTGTTQDFNDAWFSGFSPDLVTTVWIGFDNPASLGNNETGGAVAAPIWHDFMVSALRDRPNVKFDPPPGITVASWDSGYGTVTDGFKPGQTPGASTSDGTTAQAESGGSGIASGTPAPSGGTAAGVDSGLGGLY